MEIIDHKKMYELNEIAYMCGIFSKSNKSHSKLVNSIINTWEERANHSLWFSYTDCYSFWLFDIKTIDFVRKYKKDNLQFSDNINQITLDNINYKYKLKANCDNYYQKQRTIDYYAD